MKLLLALIFVIVVGVILVPIAIVNHSRKKKKLKEAFPNMRSAFNAGNFDLCLSLLKDCFYLSIPFEENEKNEQLEVMNCLKTILEKKGVGDHALNSDLALLISEVEQVEPLKDVSNEQDEEIDRLATPIKKFLTSIGKGNLLNQALEDAYKKSWLDEDEEEEQ